MIADTFRKFLNCVLLSQSILSEFYNKNCVGRKIKTKKKAPFLHTILAIATTNLNRFPQNTYQMKDNFITVILVPHFCRCIKQKLNYVKNTDFIFSRGGHIGFFNITFDRHHFKMANKQKQVAQGVSFQKNIVCKNPQGGGRVSDAGPGSKRIVCVSCFE